MKFASLHILLTAGFAAALRGNRDNDDRSAQTRRHRHLVDLGTECVTYMKIADYVDGPDEESWSCEFSPEDAKRFGLGGVQMLDIDGLTMDDMKDMHAVSGGTVLKVGPSSYVETVETASTGNVFGRGFDSATSDSIVAEPVLHVSKEDFVIEPMDEHTDSRHYKNRKMRRGRNLAATTGSLNTLVMRVIDKDGRAPPSASQLEEDVFLDSMSLKTQYERCSHDNIEIVQAQNNGFYATQNNVDYQGIIDVQVSYKASDAGKYDLWGDALDIAKRDYNNGNAMSNSFDLIMVCYPPGVDSGWIAYAYINHYISVYNNDWCKYVSGQMHEIGHNLGLLHSGKRGVNQYADQSGMMGYSYSDVDGPTMCFNAAKSYQLGWYPNQMQSVDPLQLPNGVKEYTLNGVVDYGNSDGYVTIRIEDDGQNYRGSDYYIGYNRAEDFNAGTLMGENKVQIFEKINDWGDRNGPGQSYLLASLGNGESYSWRIDRTDITVEVLDIAGKDAFITLTGDGPTVIDPTPQPTNKPTESPTDAPTSGPTKSPTDAPSSAPTESPTAVPTVAIAPVEPTTPPTTGPTASPTSAPTKAPTTVAPTGTPTSAPTASPTSGPTSAPTKLPTTVAPTGSPTGAPTVTQGICEDDNVKLCPKLIKKFVKKGKWGKLKKRCKKAFNKKKPHLGFAYERCPATCALVDLGPCA